MYIDNSTRVTVDEEVGHHEQESGQHYGIDVIPGHHCEHLSGITYLGRGHHFYRHIERTAAAYNTRLGLVAHHERHSNTAILLAEIANDILGIRTCARCKYCYIYHLVRVLDVRIHRLRIRRIAAGSIARNAAYCSS